MERIRRQPMILLALVLWLAAAAAPAADEPATAKAPAKSTGPADRWYFSKMPCDHDHGHDQPPPAEPYVRSWEPERDVNPKKILAYQDMYEVTRYPHAERPTREQQRQADELVRKSLQSAKRHGWFDFDKASKDGFKLMYSDRTHYMNEDYILDDRLLDPDRPEFLLFYDTPHGKRLAAFMFLTRRLDERGPQIGGPLTIWHYHVWAKRKCLLRQLVVVGDPNAKGECASGELTQRSPEMMHVWFIDHPQGPFATHMTLSDDMRKQLEQAKWP